MNARLYDPVLGRMISPDNFVNGAFASQAYNRYSYANNNPLKYTDPSGNNPVLIAMAIAAAINIGYQVMYNEGFNNFNVESLVLATLQGGISAGFAGAIGDALSTLTGFTKLAAGIALHGLSRGLQSAVFGGNIGQGVLSGMIGHGVGELFVGAGVSQNMGLLGNFVVGGMSSALVATAMGNDPMQAFIIGGATAAFNSFMHDKPKHKKLPAVPKHNANFHGHGLEPVYIEFDIISGYETAKGLYFGVKAAVKWGLGKAATKVGLTNPQLVQKSATLAERAIGSTGRVAGTAKHQYANALLNRYQSIYGSRGLSTNVYFNNGVGNRGFLDVLDRTNGIIYDFKFGNAVMSPAQYNKYFNNFGLPIQIIRP